MDEATRYERAAEANPVRAAVRALDILFAVATHGPATLATVCDSTGLSKGTGHRLLQTLSHRSMVLQDSDSGLYILGPGAIVIADAFMSGSGGVGLLARSPMQTLRDDTNETVTLHSRFGGQRVCIAEIPSLNPLRYTATIGGTEPIHTGSAGKVLLAYMPEDARRALLATLPLDAVTDRTITQLPHLLVELESIRQVGFAVSRGERAIGAAAVSAPVREASGDVFGALSILGPEVRMTPSRVEQLVGSLVQCANQISARLLQGSELAESP